MLVARLAEAIESDQPRFGLNYIGDSVDDRRTGYEAIRHAVISQVKLRLPAHVPLINVSFTLAVNSAFN